MSGSSPSNNATSSIASRYSTGIALAIILLVGLAVRIYHLAEEPAWFDEIVSLDHLDAPDMATFLRLERADDPPMVPAYFALLYLWSRLVSGSLPSPRVLSLIPGMLAIPLLYLLARDMYGRAAGIIAALCLALCPIHIYFSQEIRMYSLMTLLALISVYTFLRLLRDGNVLWWAAHIATNAVLVWTHFFGMLLLAVEGVFLLVFRRRHVRETLSWIAVNLLPPISLSVWIRSIDFAKLHAASSWIEPPTIHALKRGLFFYVGKSFLPPSSTFAEAIDPARPWFDVALMLFFFLAIARLGWWVFRQAPDASSAGSDNQSRRGIEIFLLLLAWLTIPLLLLCILSYIYRPCFVSRYAIHSSLSLYIIAGGAIATLPRFRMKVLTVGVLLVLYAYQLTFVLSGPMRAVYQ